MRAVKDNPVTRLFRNHLRTSGREVMKIRTSDGANLFAHPFHPRRCGSEAKGLTDFRQEIPRRVIWAESQNSAFYAEQSNYS